MDIFHKRRDSEHRRSGAPKSPNEVTVDKSTALGEFPVTSTEYVIANIGGLLATGLAHLVSPPQSRPMMNAAMRFLKWSGGFIVLLWARRQLEPLASAIDADDNVTARTNEPEAALGSVEAPEIAGTSIRDRSRPERSTFTSNQERPFVR